MSRSTDQVPSLGRNLGKGVKQFPIPAAEGGGGYRRGLVNAGYVVCNRLVGLGRALAKLARMEKLGITSIGGEKVGKEQVCVPRCRSWLFRDQSIMAWLREGKVASLSVAVFGYGCLRTERISDENMCVCARAIHDVAHPGVGQRPELEIDDDDDDDSCEVVNFGG